MSKEQRLPDPWGDHMSPKGVHSYRDLAAKTGLALETCRRLVQGKSTSVATVNAVADKLFDGDRTFVWELHGAGYVDHGDWSLPADASLLDSDQRQAILAVVKGMLPVARARKDVMGNAEHPAPTNKHDNVAELKAARKPKRQSKAERIRKDQDNDAES